jgi:hypothetical protein
MAPSESSGLTPSSPAPNERERLLEKVPLFETKRRLLEKALRGGPSQTPIPATPADGDVLRHQRERLDELERDSLQKLKGVRRKVLRG